MSLISFNQDTLQYIRLFYKIYVFAIAIFEYKKLKISTANFADVIMELQNLNNINVENLLGIYKKILKENEKKIKKLLS